MGRWPTVATVFSVLLSLTASAAADTVSFREQVAPLLQTACVGCHSGSKPKASLDLSSRAGLLRGGESGPVVVAGQAIKSRLIEMVRDKKMPPKKPLPTEAVELLRRWIDEGADWTGGDLKPPEVKTDGDLWSLRPIRRPAVPNPPDVAWTNNPIDSFVASHLARMNLVPNPEADRRTYIRRLTLDLTGLWPTPEEVDDFVKDTSPNANEKLVDRLLTSPAYGERWGRHWLDVVRFAESSGFEVNNPRTNAWGYRDYVIRALNRDTLFGQFVREQLAADTIADADELTQWATGFLVGGAHDLVGNQTEEGTRQIRSDDLFDMVSATSATFLGLTAGCARCHDHKFDPISQKDFYALEAVFAGVQHGERPLRPDRPEDRKREAAIVRSRLAEIDAELDRAEPLATPTDHHKATRPPTNPRRNVERFERVEARYVRFTITATNNGAEPCIDELEVYARDSAAGNLALATAGAKATASSEFANNPLHKIAHLNDGRHGNGRSWISAEAGRGWAQIELPKPTRISMIVWGRDREQKFQDRVPSKYRFEVSIDGEKWSTVAGDWDRSSAYVPPENVKALSTERVRLAESLARIERSAVAYVGTFGQPAPTYLLKRGDVMQRSEVVSPGAIHGIGRDLALKPDATDPVRRRALADWIADADNPLSARVMVNRLWHFHFGQGLVRTPSDFGRNGDRPVLPELLDWLAAEFRDNGGRLKPIHRLIVLSKTYRQSSRIDPEKAKIDPSNRGHWRFPSRRVEAEALRDGILQVTGALNRAAGGPGYHLWNYSNYVTIYEPKKTLGPDEFRRMVYQFKPRTQQDRTFGAFDCPDATAAVPRRPISTTALQALNLLNDEFVHSQADRFAERVRQRAGTSERSQVEMAFRLAFQRPPSERERAAGENLVRSTSLSHLCRMLLNANEFVTLE